MNPITVRIIIVEDDAAHVEAIRRALSDAGTAAEIGVAATLGEYRQSVAADPPDIALMDLNLPDGRALEVLSSPPETGPFPILIMTSYGNEQIAVEAMKAGALDYVVKSPETFAAMPHTVARALREWKAVQERKRAEAELQEAKQDWESIFQGIPHPTVILDAQQRILTGNRKIEQLLGKNVEELKNHNCWEIFHGSDAKGPPPGCPFERAVESFVDQTVEMEMEAFGGIFLVSCTPVRDARGQVNKVIHIANDITKLRRAEEVLKASEERFRMIFQHSPVGMAVTSLDGTLLRANRAYCDMFGYAEEELLRMRFYDFTHPDDRDMNREEIARLIAGEIDAVHYDKRYLRKDGGIVWASAHATVIRDSAGNPQFLTGQVLDITQRRRAQERVEHLNRVLSAIRDVNQLIVHEKDPNVLIAKACQLLVKTRGYLSALIILCDAAGVPRNFTAAGMEAGAQELADSLRDKILPPCCEEVRMRSEVYVVADRVDVCGLCPVASECPADGAICIQLRHGGTLYGYMAVTVPQGHHQDAEEQSLFTEMADDIAFALHNIELEQEARRAEEHRRLAEAQLRQAQKMEALGTLSGGIAHDFNNILGIIVGFTEMTCWDMDAASPIRANLQEVLRAAGRAKELVKQILAFSRQSEQEKRPVPIGLIIKETLRMLRASLPTTIRIESDVTSNAAVLADPTQIHQVLMNLCANAAHAMRADGGTLQVNLADVYCEQGSLLPAIGLQPGPHVRLTIEDTGHGIDPAIMDRIFDPFFTTKETGIGTGLGLAVVHGIVRSLGGAVQADSTPGQGTVFHLYFPAVVATLVAETELPDSFPTGHERVLLVDDEPALVMATKKILENLGYHVDYHTSSVEALEAFRRQPADQPYQLVITDMTMPQMTGADLAKELHRLQPDLSIIVCTGFSEKINPEKAKDLGIQGFLMKPVVMKELAEMVRNVLDENR